MTSEFDLDTVKTAFAEHRGGRYRIDAIIGKGGMGTVFAAFDAGFRERPCAIKVLNLDKSDNEQILARFRREARAMVKIKHPAVVEVFDLDELADGLTFIVLELVAGGSLSSYIQDHGQLSPQMAINVLIIVCGGIEAAHALGIIHRDIKPDNILLEPKTGNPKVTDFGIAMVKTRATRLTQDGTGMGSVGFMAPEQMNARDVDARADVYALGVTLWSILNGESPSGLFFTDVEDRSVNLFRNIPVSLVEIIRKATCRTPDDRYDNVADLRTALIAAGDNLPTAGSTTQPYESVIDSEATASPRALLLPVPAPQDLFVGATIESSTKKPSSMSKPHHQTIAARLVSPRPSRTAPGSIPPVAADTMHDGATETFGGSKTQFTLALKRIRRASAVRLAIVVLFLCGVGGGVWWWFGRDRASPAISQSPETSATTAATTPQSPTKSPNTEPVSRPESPKPEAPKTKEALKTKTVHPTDPAETVPQREAEALPVRQKRSDIVNVAIIPLASESSILERGGKPAQRHEKSVKDRPPAQPIKVKRPPDEGKTAVAETSKAPEPVVEAQRVGLTFPDGDPVKVWLVGPSGRYNLPDNVPPGSYKVVAAFPSGERTAIQSLTVGSARVTISCQTPIMKCRSH
jgi:serine/threonine protein kinase